MKYAIIIKVLFALILMLAVLQLVYAECYDSKIETSYQMQVYICNMAPDADRRADCLAQLETEQKYEKICMARMIITALVFILLAYVLSIIYLE